MQTILSPWKTVLYLSVLSPEGLVLPPFVLVIITKERSR